MQVHDLMLVIVYHIANIHDLFLFPSTVWRFWVGIGWDFFENFRGKESVGVVDDRLNAWIVVISRWRHIFQLINERFGDITGRTFFYLWDKRGGSLDYHLTLYCNCSQPSRDVSLLISLGEDLFILFWFCFRLLSILVAKLLVEEGIVVIEEGLQVIRHREAWTFWVGPYAAEGSYCSNCIIKPMFESFHLVLSLLV